VLEGWSVDDGQLMLDWGLRPAAKRRKDSARGFNSADWCFQARCPEGE